MKAISVDAAQAIDRRSVEEFHYTSDILMEAAAIAIWQRIRSRISHGQGRGQACAQGRGRGQACAPAPVPAQMHPPEPAQMQSQAQPQTASSLLVLCGAGNNGGDGLALARWAHHDGHTVAIVDCASPQQKKSALNARNAAICAALGIPIYTWSTQRQRVLSLVAACDCIVDAITGIGTRGALRDTLSPLVAAVNKRNGAACEARDPTDEGGDSAHETRDLAHEVRDPTDEPRDKRPHAAPPRASVFAIDVPSGLGEQFHDSYPAIRASRTYTIGLPKRFCFTPLARPYCGDIVVTPIGFPASALDDQPGSELLTIADLRRLYHPPSRFTHKYARGVVAIHAGGGATIGAALMAADGAAATGAGLIHLYPRLADCAAISAARPSYITHPPPMPRQPAASEATRIVNSAPASNSAPSSDAILPTRCDALCIGPGWGITNDTRALFDALLDTLPVASRPTAALDAASRPTADASAEPSDVASRPAAASAPSDVTAAPPNAATNTTPTSAPSATNTTPASAPSTATSPPGVIDADALTLLAEKISFQANAPRLPDDAPPQHNPRPTEKISFQDSALHLHDPRLTAGALRGWILTPHCAEFARLLDIDIATILRDPLPYLELCARRLQVVIVLKSFVTHIVDPTGRHAILDGANITLATAGSGDILAGIITALLAQRYPPFHAARLGVLIHHHAGLTAKRRNGYHRADHLPKHIATNVLSYGNRQ